MKDRKIELVLFDLGGVLVELGEHPFPPEWHRSKPEFGLTEWFHSKAAMAFESGRMSPQQFASALIRNLQLNTTEADLIQEFTAWPQGLFPGVEDLLELVNTRYRTAILSNTNELHWPRMLSEFKLEELVDDCFASHLLNMAKPDPAIFTRVLQKLRATPNEVLFFDDNKTNVEAAQTLGINAIQVNGISELKIAITNNLT